MAIPHPAARPLAISLAAILLGALVAIRPNIAAACVAAVLILLTALAKRHLVPVVVVAVIMLAAFLLYAPAQLTNSLELAVALLILAIAVAVGIAASRRAYSELGWLNPCIIPFVVVLVLYILRPMYDISHGTVGSPQIGIDSLSGHGSEAAHTALILAAGVSLFTAAFWLVDISWWRTHLSWLQSQVYRPPSRAALFGAFLVSAVSAILILRRLQQFEHGTFAALTDRNRALEGSNFLVFFLETYKFAAIAYIGTRLQMKLNGEIESLSPSLIFVWLLTVPLDLVSGERATLIVANLLLFGGMLSFYWSRASRLPTLSRRAVAVLTVLILLVGVFTFVGYRLYVRDTRGGASAGDVAQTVLHLPDYAFSSDEAAAFDYAVVSRRAIPSQLPYRGAANLTAIAVAAVPSALWSGKPERGSTLLTKLLTPEAYAHGADIAFSGAVDLYYTAGDAGVLLGLLFLGLLGGWLIRGPLTRESVIALGVSFYTAYLVLTAIRTDLFVLGLLPIRILLLGVTIRLVRGPAHGLKRSSTIGTPLGPAVADQG